MKKREEWRWRRRREPGRVAGSLVNTKRYVTQVQSDINWVRQGNEEGKRGCQWQHSPHVQNPTSTKFCAFSWLSGFFTCSRPTSPFLSFIIPYSINQKILNKKSIYQILNAKILRAVFSNYRVKLWKNLGLAIREPEGQKGRHQYMEYEKANRAKSIINHSEFVVINDINPATRVERGQSAKLVP